jgi:hypothetical protein
MKMVLLTCVLWTVLCGALTAADASAAAAQSILALERETMEGWRVGNPDPALALLDPSITYYHYPLQERLQGLPAVADFFEPYRGRPLFDAYEMLDPEVQASGDVAILTYQLLTHNGSRTDRWNSTEVFSKKEGGWRIIHAHWSKVDPPRPVPQP